MQVQSVGTSAGELHNTLTSMDHLLHHLETRRTQPGSKHFMVSLNVGWLKLRKYYQITDLNPSYIMAVFLNPHYRDAWFQDHWKPAFVTFTLTTVGQQYAAAKLLYNLDASERSSTPPPARHKELTGYAAYNEWRTRLPIEPWDEIAKYKGITDPPESQDPLDWLVQNQDQYPVLKHLAFTLMAAPASTAADERFFSIGGSVVNEERPHTQQQLAESVKCLRSWYHKGLI